MLIVSNWHFVRDNQEKKECPPCRPEDCNISLKLSSTLFKSNLSSDLRPTTGEVLADEGFTFDRNGIIIPYSAFLSLMTDAYFLTVYLPGVRTNYEKLRGSLNFEDYAANECGSDHNPVPVPTVERPDFSSEFEKPFTDEEEEEEVEKIANDDDDNEDPARPQEPGGEPSGSKKNAEKGKTGGFDFSGKKRKTSPSPRPPSSPASSTGSSKKRTNRTIK